jgi:hypothetical protein
MKKKLLYSELIQTVATIGHNLMNKKFAIVVLEREQALMELKTYSGRTLVERGNQKFVDVNLKPTNEYVLAEILIFTDAKQEPFIIPVFDESGKGANVSSVDFQKESITFYFINAQGKKVGLVLIWEELEKHTAYHEQKEKYV